MRPASVPVATCDSGPSVATSFLRRTRAPALAVLAFTLAAACTATPVARTEAAPAARRIISVEQIQRSRSNNAWDLLREHALINTSQTDSRGQFRVQSRRGRSSVVLGNSDVPLVVVDGVRVIEPGTLRQIPADVIRSIRLLGPIEGTTYMGTNAGAGVIVIETSAGGT